MAKTKFIVPRRLLTAVLLSFLTIVVSGIIVLFVMLIAPNSVYHKIFEWMELNRFNPEIYSTQYYIRLSLIANVEDWVLVTPLSYVLGGIVFGSVMLSSYNRAKTLKSSMITSFVFTALVLIICFYSSDILQATAEKQGMSVASEPYGTHEIIMGLVQTVYWTAAFVAGSYLATVIRALKHPVQQILPKPSIAA